MNLLDAVSVRHHVSQLAKLPVQSETKFAFMKADKDSSLSRDRNNTLFISQIALIFNR